MFKTILSFFFIGLVAAPLAMLSTVPSLAQTTDSSSIAEATGWSNFMAPEEVATVIEQGANVQIIDIRASKYVRRGTILGAVSVPLSRWRGEGDQARQPLPPTEMATLLGDAGIRLDQPIVVYSRSGRTVQMGQAAIVYWIIKSAGAKDIAIMKGGFKEWRAAGLPEAVEPTNLDPVATEVAFNYGWWADPMDIFAIATRQKEGAILDARLDGQVRKSVETGEPLMSMPMAQYIPASFFTNQLTAENMTVPAKNEFREALESRGIDLGTGMLISVCQTGELSALSWFYASEIVGIENVRYYPDALRGWAGDGGLMFGMRSSL